MLDRVSHRLHHIIDAIGHIEMLLSNKTREAAVADPFIWAAYERFLEIISEASRHIPVALKEKHPEVQWRQIADIGNHLRHGYDGLDDAILWNIHQKGQLAVLLVTAQKMLGVINK